MLRIFLTLCLVLSCSAARNNFAPRIVGGEVARAGQYPYAAAIHVSTEDSKFFCGGTLVTVQWVITAGQCVYRATLATIQLGSNHLKSPDPNRVNLASSEFVVHPDFNPITLENDVGFIELRMPVHTSEYIQPIHGLPETDFGGSRVGYAMGWGHIDDDAVDLSDELNYVRVTALSNAECRIIFGNQIKDTMLCVTGEYNEGICTGDTGSSLIELMMGNGRLVGIASFISGNGCESTDPSGYVRLHSYLDWIKNVTGI